MNSPVTVKKFIVISYYTKDTGYEVIVEKLVASLNKFEIPHKITALESRGSWELNIRMKPDVILTAMRNFPEHDILFMDADIQVSSKIEFPGLEGAVLGLCDGMMALRNDEATYNLILQWSLRQENNDAPSKIILEELLAGATIKNLATPVVVNQQASLVLKEAVERGFHKVPKSLYGSRIRHMGDGSIAIAQQSAPVEAFLDARFRRVPNQLRWELKAAIRPDQWLDLQADFKRNLCCIVGKGPSLDRLTASDFPAGATIICLNESIHRIETLNLPNATYCMQQDTPLRDGCRPKRARLIVNMKSENFYPGLSNKIVFVTGDLGLTAPTVLTAVCAVKLAAMAGAGGFKMMAFDAVTSGDLTYAPSVGKNPAMVGRPDRFLTHGNKIKLILEQTGLPYSFYATQAPMRQSSR